MAGVASRESKTCCAVPPDVQAVTVHWAACPRELLACAAAALTQRRLTCLPGAVVVVPASGDTCVREDAGDRVRVRVGSGVAAGLAVTDLVEVTAGDGLADGVVRRTVLVGVFAGGAGVFAFAVFVAAGLDAGRWVGDADVADGAGRVLGAFVCLALPSLPL